MTNEELDTAILARLAKESMRFTDLQIAIGIEPFPRSGWRQLDRRLQSLRKRGLIEYNSKYGWSVFP